MKKKNSKLWILILTIFILCSVISISCSIPLELEKEVQEQENPGYGDTVIESETEEVVSSLKTDFKKFGIIVNDFINVVFRGGESQFDSAWAVLLGHEDVIIEEPGEDKENVITEPIEIIPKDKSQEDIITSCTVKYVIDGDTFMADYGDGVEKKIRLIGIDTPESVNSNESLNNIWGEYASAHTKSILSEGQTVFIEYDIETEDVYGRTLAYVWLNKDTSNINNMLNARLLSEGYAMNKMFLPNSKYAKDFEVLRMDAQNNGYGLWADEGFAALWE